MAATDFSNRGDVIAVKAKLRLLTTKEGGRHTPIRSGYRPNHFFEPYKGSFIGEVQFEGISELNPGEEHLVIVYFLDVSELRHLLSKGNCWKIQEGSKLVGIGEIITNVVL